MKKVGEKTRDPPRLPTLNTSHRRVNKTRTSTPVLGPISFLPTTLNISDYSPKYYADHRPGKLFYCLVNPVRSVPRHKRISPPLATLSKYRKCPTWAYRLPHYVKPITLLNKACLFARRSLLAVDQHAPNA